MKVRRGTEEERRAAIDAARERLEALRTQTFEGWQLPSVAIAERSELKLIERLERGDLFIVPCR